MLALTFTNSGPPLREDDITAFERRYGLELPRTYREFLMRNNGGVPSYRRFSIPGHQDPIDSVTCFLGINHRLFDGLMDLDEHARTYHAYRNGGLVVIGVSECNSFLCLDLASEGREAVVYVDIADPLDERGRKRAWPLAPNVVAFLRCLREETLPGAS